MRRNYVRQRQIDVMCQEDALSWKRRSVIAESLNVGVGVHFITLKCLSIGTLKAINFPFVSNEKLMFFRCPNIQAHCNEAVIYLNFGTSKNNEFAILGVPIHKHIRADRLNCTCAPSEVMYKLFRGLTIHI